MKKYSAIRLTPNMDMDTVSTSLNENFTLLENYTRLYFMSGAYTFPSETVAGLGTVVQTAEIEHNMGEVPRYRLFVEKDDSLDPVTTLPGFPASSSIPVHWGMSYSNQDFNYTYFIGADSNKVYVYRRLVNSSASSADTPEEALQYYLFDEAI